MLNHNLKNNFLLFAIVSITIQTFLYPNNDNKDVKENFWESHNNNGINFSRITLNDIGTLKQNNLNYKISIHFSGNNFLLGETFIRKNFQKNYSIKIGRFYKDFSKYTSEELSSGSMLISRNAQPMPKISMLKNTKINSMSFNEINLQLGISHGLFDKNDIYTKSPMLHEKFIYLNITKNKNIFSLGFVHEAIWGGDIINNSSFPSSVEDFFKVFIAADAPKNIDEPHANALGNHLGIWDFNFKRKLSNSELSLYHQHLFEDTSGLRFANKFDGLWGIEFSNLKNDSKLLLEYITTRSENRDPPYVNESYYNHYQYLYGWRYKNIIIGNPYVEYYNDSTIDFFHLGMQKSFIEKINVKVILARNTNRNDFLKYKLMIGFKANKIKLLFSGQEKQSNEIGLQISFNK